MRTKVIFLFLVTFTAVSIAVGQTGDYQTKDDLNQKYGAPDTEGRYTARPNIGVAAKFNDNNQLTELSIKPLSSMIEIPGNPPSSGAMFSETAENVLDELIPNAIRGKQKSTGNAEFGCTSSDYIEYERVSINIVTRCSQQGGGTYFINIRWRIQPSEPK